jgi:hypothetical protein
VTQVQLITKPNQEIVKGKITVIPVGLLKYYQNIRGDLFISTWGLSESAKYAQDYVVSHNWFGAKHIMLGYQQKSTNLPHAEYPAYLIEKRGGKKEELSLPPHNFLAWI